MINKNFYLCKQLTWKLIIIFSFFGGYIGIGSFAGYKMWIIIYLFMVTIMALSLKKIKYLKTSTKNFTFKVFVIWGAYGVLSLLWCIDRGLAIKNIYYVFIALILISGCIGNFKNYDELNKFNQILKIMIFISMIIGIWESVTGNHLYLSAANYASKPEYRFTPTGFQVNTNDYATLLTIYMPIILISFKKNKRNLIDVSLIGIYTYLLLMTNSRANQIAFIIGVLTYFLLMNTRKKLKYIYITLISVIIVFMLIPGSFSETFSQFEYNVKSDIGTNSDRTRINLIKNGCLMLEDNYLLGVGAGNIEANMPNYSSYNYVGSIKNMHNFWMEILVDYGVIIFIIFISWYYSVIRKLFTAYKDLNLKQYKRMISLMITSMIMFIISSMSSSSIMSGVYIWIYFGYILTFINIYEKELIKNENISFISYVSK